MNSNSKGDDIKSFPINSKESSDSFLNTGSQLQTKSRLDFKLFRN